MNILGIMVGTNSTAALLKDGELIACVSEERYLRKKNADVYPKNAVDYCLKEAAISATDIDVVVFDSKDFNYQHWVVNRDGSFTVADWIREQNLYWKPVIYENKKVDYFDLFNDKIVKEHYTKEIVENYVLPNKDIRPELVKNHLGDNIKKIENSFHYESHHYYGYYASPYREGKVLSFVMEGWGDGTNATVAIFENGVYNEIYRTDLCNIGRLYRYVTLILGMKPNEHEYKVMGLGAYNDFYEKALEVFDSTLYVDGTDFKYRERPTDHYFWFKERLEGFRFDMIAAALQKHVEVLVCQWIGNWIKKTGIGKIVVSGGVAMNIKAMMEVSKLDELEEMFVPGNGSDESTAIGACYRTYVNECVKKDKNPNSIPKVKNLYLGNSYSKDEIANAVKRAACDKFFVRENVTSAEVAKVLADGEPVARFSGRMEFGARSLGNRSLLADPRSLNVVRKINHLIKCRDFWMPFAPVVLKERLNDYFLNPKDIKSPYMTIGFESTELAVTDLIAGLHQGDLTGRPQILERDFNPGYYDLIKAFESITGVGGLVNTSFNLHGEPIVNTPEDAIYVFLKSGLEYLLLEDTLLCKK